MASEKATRLAYSNMVYHLRNLERAIFKAEQMGALEKPDEYSDNCHAPLNALSERIDALSLKPLAKSVQNEIYKQAVRKQR